MLKRVFSVVMFILLVTSMLTLALKIQPGKAEPTTIIVPDDYPTIQAAIGAAEEGGTIHVRAGTYLEHVVVNKVLTLIGESRETTIIDANETGTPIEIRANGVKISGFTVQKNIDGYGVYLNNSNYCSITENSITNSGFPIRLEWSSNNIISKNNVTNNFAYVGLYWSQNNIISENSITANTNGGIGLADSFGNWIFGNNITNNKLEGIHLSYSSDNSISGNSIVNNWHAGIALAYSSNNTIFRNSIVENGYRSLPSHEGYGIWLSGSSDNLFYHNDFVNNSNEVQSSSYTNKWDVGYPSGGNYWSNYTGFDVNSGPNQNMTGSDGIGDIPNIIDTDNQDRYPLMHPWSYLPVHNINTGLGYVAIQEAINANETLDGHIIFVEAGIYQSAGALFVNKTINLIAESRVVTIIDSYEVDVTANNVTLSGFAILGCVSLEADGCTVNNNTIFDAYWYGVGLLNCTNNEIRNNVLLNSSPYSVYLSDSSNNTISQNYIDSIEWDGSKPLLDYGIWMRGSSNNSIVQNNLFSCRRAIDIEQYGGYEDVDKSSNNKIVENNIEHSDWGVRLSWSSNNTILENNIKASGLWRGMIPESIGISLGQSFNNSIVKNNIEYNGEGVKLVDSSLNSITDNNLTDNFYGILLQGSQANSLIGNNVTNSPVIFEGSNETGRVGNGILISYPYYSNLLRNNSIAGYMYNFGMENAYSYYFQDIDTSNTVDGKPIYYWVNRQNGEIPSDAGYVAIVNSTNIRVEGLDLRNNYQGILIANSNDTTILHNNVTNNRYGIRFESSLDNTISENNVTDNRYDGISFANSYDNYVFRNRVISPSAPGTGISLDSSWNNTLSQNTVSNNTTGISLSYSSDNNTISENTIALNYVNVWFVFSSNNIIYHNNFYNYTQQAGSWPDLQGNVWDNGYPSGGNYWSDCNGTDLYSGRYQNETGSDGMSDAPYIIDADNTDLYPLMRPYGTLLGDVNGDGEVNMRDVMAAVQAFNSFRGYPRWNADADLDGSGRVTIRDLLIVVLNFNKHQ